MSRELWCVSRQIDSTYNFTLRTSQRFSVRKSCRSWEQDGFALLLFGKKESMNMAQTFSSTFCLFTEHISHPPDWMHFYQTSLLSFVCFFLEAILVSVLILGVITHILDKASNLLLNFLTWNLDRGRQYPPELMSRALYCAYEFMVTVHRTRSTYNA